MRPGSQQFAVTLSVLIALVCCANVGCRSDQANEPDLYYPEMHKTADETLSVGDFAKTAMEIEYPDLPREQTADWYYSSCEHVLPPNKRKTWELQLEQAVRMALARSQVIRDLGGTVVDTPEAVTTVFDPAIRETDPTFGVQAALSRFDAQLGTQFFFAGRERSLNNAIEGDGTQDPRATFGAVDINVSKTAATGSQFRFSNLTTYDHNNSPLNRFSSAYTGAFTAEFRQPLLQGAGIEFNRIAGPDSRPGQYRGVLVARLNTDVQLADFEAAIRNLLSDVERAYWELNFAFRNLDAKIIGRDAALAIWRAVQAGRETGEADGEQEALARERYYEAQVAVDNALFGEQVRRTSINLARARIDGFPGGLLAAERRLRFLVGLPVYDGKLIRPSDEPVKAKIVFNRRDTLSNAFTRRVELRRQMWKIKRQELELVAARNFLKPRLDVVGQYRVHGFGDDLFGKVGVPNGSAYGDLFRGDLQDWFIGFEFKSPIGKRIGHVAVRNAELKLAREKKILREQEHRIAHELDAALSELERAYIVSRASYNRRRAARQRAGAVRAKYQDGNAVLEFVEDAQHRAVEADSDFAWSLVNYNIALANVHYSRGSYLEYLGVYLTESPSSPAAYESAARQTRRFRPNPLNYCLDKTVPLSTGPHAQHWLNPDEVIIHEGELETARPNLSPGQE